MPTVKRVYTDNELDEMCADEFFNALGIKDEVYQEIDEANDRWVNCTGIFYKWDPDKEDHGTSNPTMIVRTDTLK